MPSCQERCSSVGDVEVDLRPVERALPRADEVLDLVPLERLDELPLREVPFLIGAELVVGPRRELGPRLDPEEAVEVAEVRETAVELGVDLLLGAEDVRVVLGHIAHAGEPVERPGELVAVERRRLRVAQRQVAVAAQLAAEQEHVARAVHRLDGVGVLVVDRDQEHVLAELLPVARGDPERLVVDQRRLDLRVAAAGVLAPAQVLEHVEDRHPLGMPERRPRRELVEVEEVELRAEPAVVACLRLLEQLEARVEVLLGEERRPVDPGQLRVVRVAAPVGAGERRELEGLDRRRVLEVRAAAEVREVALRIQRDGALSGVDELDLVRLVLGLEPRAGLVGRDLLALPRATLGELAVHLGLDRLEVGRR